MRCLTIVLCCVLLLTVSECYADKTQDFLRGNTHSWLPYPLPYETTLEQVEKVCGFGTSTVGIVWAAPYNNGNIDFEKLDQALETVTRHHQKMVLFMTPRFAESDNVADRLSNGESMVGLFNRSPNYSILDIFDPVQRNKFNEYVRRCVKRYGSNPNVAAFVIGWGYQGESGFYNGDWVSDSAKGGTVNAGYSENALSEYNKWRAKRHLPHISSLPLPSAVRQSDAYILFMRFRSDFVRNTFQRGYTAAAKANTSLPVGDFAYLPSSPESYARNWTDTPNADFFRSACSCATYDMSRTLLDSGIGWEDSALHDGKWDFTAKCMQRDEARQLAKGAVFHAMPVSVYESEPQWEPGVFAKILEFLKNQRIYKSIVPVKPSVALYQPTWGIAAVPARNTVQLFLPDSGFTWYITKMVGLTESFGLPYRLITESDLMDSKSLGSYEHIIVPMWDYIPRIAGEQRYAELAKDKRVIGIPSKDRALTRTEFREILKKSKVRTYLDFDSERILAGRTANMVYNWDAAPMRVRVPEKADPIDLSGHEYLILTK